MKDLRIRERALTVSGGMSPASVFRPSTARDGFVGGTSSVANDARDSLVRSSGAAKDDDGATRVKRRKRRRLWHGPRGEW